MIINLSGDTVLCVARAHKTLQLPVAVSAERLRAVFFFSFRSFLVEVRGRVGWGVCCFSPAVCPEWDTKLTGK